MMRDRLILRPSMLLFASEGSVETGEAPKPRVSRSTFRRVVTLVAAILALASAGTPPPKAASDPAANPVAATPDGEWLVDEEGRQFKIQRWDKTLPHMRVDGNRVRTLMGLTADLAGEDETSFLVKIYRVTEVAPTVIGMTPEEKLKVAAAYEFDLKTSRTMSFEPFDAGLPRTGQWRYGFALADMNGDGHVDIVHGPPRRQPGPPVIFLGDGAGHWRRWQASFPAERFDYGNVAVADFNGDGHLDIAMGMHLLGMTVLLGDGTGRFKSSSKGMDPPNPQNAFSSHALVAVDWDGDGHVDLVALGEGPRLGTRPDPKNLSGFGSSSQLVLYRNRGDATWEKRAHPKRMFGDSLVLAPSRWDGRPWLVAGTTEQGQRDLVLRPGDPFATEALPGLRPNALVRAVAVADFDGDGHDDFAVAYAVYEGEQWRSGVDLILRRPDRTTERRTVFFEESPRAAMALAAGDLDGDGRPDLVALSGDGEIRVLRNAGGGTFTREDVQLTERTPGCQGYSVRVQDLDKDGRADIVAGFAGEPEGLAFYRIDGCPKEGSLRAWRSRPRS
jgi:VCBS repeat protein/FG-GAP repeat protein